MLCAQEELPCLGSRRNTGAPVGPVHGNQKRQSAGGVCLHDLQVEDATDYVNQQVEDAQRSIEEKRTHAQQSLEQYQKVCGFKMQCWSMRAHITAVCHMLFVVA